MLPSRLTSENIMKENFHFFSPSHTLSLSRNAHKPTLKVKFSLMTFFRSLSCLFYFECET